jgi:surface protein
VNLPLYGITSVDVNWGDGTVVTYTSANHGLTTHNYTLTGSFDITITGTMAKFGRGDPGAPWTGVTLLTSVSSFGTLGITDLSQAFLGASSLVAVPNTLPSSVTNMRGMFYDAGIFNQPLNSWNTSNVTDMSYMFYGAIAFNQSLTTSGNSWNTSNVTDMSNMFQGASAFNQPLNSWNTSKVTNMVGMFNSASTFDQPLNSWNTSKVTDMRYMFYRASIFNQPLNSWDTSNVTDMRYMFVAPTSWSSANVDATLIGWGDSTRTQRAGVRLTIATCRSAASNTAIANLRARPWTITFPSCTGDGTN